MIRRNIGMTTTMNRIAVVVVVVVLLLLMMMMMIAVVPTTDALSTSSSSSSDAISVTKVAVIGTTGRLGREVIQQLSNRGIATRCLLRHDPPVSTAASVSSSSKISKSNNKEEILSYLQSLPGVELIKGDIMNRTSIEQLLIGTSACIAVHGPIVPKPILRTIIFPQLFYNEDTIQYHPKQINYIAIQNILQTMIQSSSTTCQHLIRITGKGETPYSIFSILINMFSGIAKGWNYEGEQYIRTFVKDHPNIKYTIIRPGIMKDTLSTSETTKELLEPIKESEPILGLRDNGMDLKVTAVTYKQIANLIVSVLFRNNCYRTTITAMNIVVPKENNHDNDNDINVYQTIDTIQPDTRQFPSSLIQQHKRAARLGGITFISIGCIIIYTIVSNAIKLLR